MRDGKSIIMKTFLLISILMTTIVYSAFSTQLQIQGDAVLRARKDIRITSVQLMEYTGQAYETYSPKYSTDTTSLFVTLPANSLMKYEITITNKSEVDYVVSKIDELSHTNPNVTYTVGLEIDEDVIDYASSPENATEKKFIIIISNNTETTQEETLFLQYKFEEATYTASQLSYSNGFTDCKTIQCALDELAGLIR